MLMVIIYIDEADNSSEQTVEAIVVLCANAAVFFGIFIQDTPLTAKVKSAATKTKECITNPRETGAAAKQAALRTYSAATEAAAPKCSAMKYAAARACSSCCQHAADEANEAIFDTVGKTSDPATSMELDGGLVLEAARSSDVR